MKDSQNKIITMCLLISFLIFNVFGIFFNVPVVSAQQNTVSDDLIIGSLINASQGGQQRGGNPEVARVGNHVIGGQKRQGRRLGVTPRRGGGRVSWNPSLIDIDIAYNDYRDYISNTDDSGIYVLPINRTFSWINNSAMNSGMTRGFQFHFPGENNIFNTERWASYNIPQTYEYAFIENISQSEGVTIRHVLSNGKSPFDTLKPRDTNYHIKKANTYRYSSNGLSQRIQIQNIFRDEIHSWTVGNVYFTNDGNLNLDDIIFAHSPNNLPTKQEFISNYTNTFNVEYDNTTNQLIQNDNYHTYNINDFSDNSLNINNSYVTNNNIIINDDKISEQLNYTSLLERIISSIKDLPQQVRDKFDDFSGGGGGGSSEPPAVEEGKGFWASLFDAVAALVTSLSDFITSIPQIILDLLDGLLGLVEKIVELFIPTAEQMDELKQSFSGLTDDLSFKFSPITESVESIKTVFSSPKSIYSLTYDFNGQTINVIPIQLQNQINNFRSVLNGVVVLTTFISIYKRFVGREDVIK